MFSKRPRMTVAATNTPAIKRAFGNIAASTTDGTLTKEDGNTLAAITGKRLLVVWLRIIVGGTATDVTFNSKGSGSGTAIDSKISAGANGGVFQALNSEGYFQTKSGETLTVTTGSGSTVGVSVGYIEVG